MPEVIPPKVNPIKELSQHQKIVATMCQSHSKEWWLPHEFMQPGEFFVGYEASARLSELQSQYPQMFDSERYGKYMRRRIRFEDGKAWYPTIPKDLQLMVKKYYEGSK